MAFAGVGRSVGGLDGLGCGCGGLRHAVEGLCLLGFGGVGCVLVWGGVSFLLAAAHGLPVWLIGVVVGVCGGLRTQ